MLKKISVILLLVFLSASPCYAQKSDKDLSASVDSVFSHLNTKDVPGVAVLVVKDGKVIVRKGYGLANLEHRAAITPSTVFDIASMSKQFTGMAIAMLIEQGKISLSNDIRKYIPELPDYGHTITIDHLVHHTSGIRDWPGAMSLAGLYMEDLILYDDILNFTYNLDEINFEPGSEHEYSNTNYNLLAELVKRVTGKTFREWTDEHIFKPLGMNNTHFHDDHTEVVPNKAYGYSRDRQGKYHAVANGLTAIGSSSLYTTIDDLAKWVINLDDPKVGGKKVLEQMQQCGVLNNGKKLEYAFGLSIGEYRGLKTISHAGGWASFSTFLLHFPEEHFSVVVLMNHSPSNPYMPAYLIADRFLADALEPAQPVKQVNKQDSGNINIPDQVLDEYTGIYRLGPAWYVKISRQGKQLFTRATAENIFPMTATSDSTFTVQAYSGRSIDFNRDESGKVTGFNYAGMTCPKLEEAPAPDISDLNQYTGKYFCKELQAFYTIILEDNQLVVTHRRLNSFKLIHAYKNDFRGTGVMTSLKFKHDENKNIIGFEAAHPRNKKFMFVKQ